MVPAGSFRPVVANAFPFWGLYMSYDFPSGAPSCLLTVQRLITVCDGGTWVTRAIWTTRFKGTLPSTGIMRNESIITTVFFCCTLQFCLPDEVAELGNKMLEANTGL